MRIETLPPVLILHLKRFKFVEKLGRFVKLNFRVEFSETLTLPTGAAPPAAAAAAATRPYALTAVVAHVGSGMRQGHYVAYVKKSGHWFLFDDDAVSLVTWAEVQQCYGDPDARVSNTGYLLFYA